MKINSSTRWALSIGLVSLCFAIAACGGGTDEPALAGGAQTTSAGSDEPTEAAGRAHVLASRSLVPITRPPGAIERYLPLTLASLSTPVAATGAMIGGLSAACREGFVARPELILTTAAALPTSGGATFNAADLARWRSRITTGPYLRDGDVGTGSPGDWTRILGNANLFMGQGEVAVTTDNRAGHGMRARDAAFYALVTNNNGYRDSVRAYLIKAAKDPANDFALMCFRSLANDTWDGFYEQAPWLMRHLVAYDYVRSGIGLADRVLLENYFRRQAYFFAANIDWGLRMAFPNRLSGDYSVRDRDAAPRTDSETWATKRYDTNGDCRVDASDDTTQFPVYAYVTSSGQVGPRLSILSMWFNNRRAANVAAFAAGGMVLGDTVLVNRAKRYVLEWLTYSVYPDGSDGEYFRNGDYCVPKQGLQYGQASLQAATLLADWLNKKGDNTLVNFSTSAGLFGTQGSTASQTKSIETVVNTQLQLVTRALPWFQHEGWKSVQAPRDATHLGRVEQRYMGTGVFDSYHELGLLASAAAFPNVNIKGVVTRDPAVTSVRLPGATRNNVASGVASWQDVFGALPAILLTY